jgi:hypothetical protein
MAIAALVVSIVAIFVSVASASYARIVAVATKGLHVIERERRHDERRPRFSAVVQVEGAAQHGQSARGILTLTLESEEPLAGVTLRMESGAGVSFPVIYGAVPPKPGAVTLAGFVYDHYSGEPSGMKPHDSETWAVDVQADRKPRMRLDLTCFAKDGEHWPVVVEAEIKAHPTEFMFVH